MNRIIKQKLKGFLISNIVAMIIISITKYTISRNGGAVFIFSEFVIVPALMGMISSWYWQELRLGGWMLTLYCCLNGFLAILLSAIFLKEGAICLLIVSPLVFCFIIAGAFIGRYLFTRNNDKFSVSLVIFFLVIYVGDTLSTHQFDGIVSDTLIIHAPVGTVWHNVVAFKKIKQKNNYLLFKFGLPSPMQTTVTGYYKGAGRKCIFSNGYVFDEIISIYRQDQNLTFDIVNQPRDPEIMNHIDITRGQFLLTDNGNGTTTLTGNSWYKLYIFPSWYYNIWSASIVRNVHVRVMEHIKQISER